MSPLTYSEKDGDQLWMLHSGGLKDFALELKRKSMCRQADQQGRPLLVRMARERGGGGRGGGCCVARTCRKVRVGGRERGNGRACAPGPRKDRKGDQKQPKRERNRQRENGRRAGKNASMSERRTREWLSANAWTSRWQSEVKDQIQSHPSAWLPCLPLSPNSRTKRCGKREEREKRQKGRMSTKAVRQDLTQCPGRPDTRPPPRAIETRVRGRETPRTPKRHGMGMKKGQAECGRKVRKDPEMRHANAKDAHPRGNTVAQRSRLGVAPRPQSDRRCGWTESVETSEKRSQAGSAGGAKDAYEDEDVGPDVTTVYRRMGLPLQSAKATAQRRKK
ncbi:hypothetical protein DFH06DRAFT_1291924 [Mycena polygramma]|nr:hypothetical protein DFH06DRAFT_1291924 [Mycena polygramma]